MSIEDITKEALCLAPEARAHLARELLTSLEPQTEAEIERLWIEEAVRRNNDLDSGAARSHPSDEVLARARARRK
jgi:hypothetical protein